MVEGGLCHRPDFAIIPTLLRGLDHLSWTRTGVRRQRRRTVPRGATTGTGASFYWSSSCQVFTSQE